MSLLCDVCGCVYHWEMFFHNHRRDVHGISTKKSKRTSLATTNKALLETYYRDVCKRPCLEEIEHVAEFLNIKKETVYWWFVNRNKQKRKSIKLKSNRCKVSSKRHVDGKGRVDRVPPRTLERGKRSEKESDWGKYQLNQRFDKKVRKHGNGTHFRSSLKTFAPSGGENHMWWWRGWSGRIPTFVTHWNSPGS